MAASFTAGIVERGIDSFLAETSALIPDSPHYLRTETIAVLALLVLLYAYVVTSKSIAWYYIFS